MVGLPMEGDSEGKEILGEFEKALSALRTKVKLAGDNQ
jgi:hypothetical protein